MREDIYSKYLRQYKDTFSDHPNDPFLNRCYFDTDINNSDHANSENRYNRNILVLGNMEESLCRNESRIFAQIDTRNLPDNYFDNPEKDYQPYILDIQKNHLELLCKYFGLYPLHRTNRFGIESGFTPDNNYAGAYYSFISEFISDTIAPKIIITFDKEIGKIIKKYYQFEMENSFENESFWSGYIKLKNRYYFFYCIPDVQCQNISDDVLYRFIMSSAIYEFQFGATLNSLLLQYPNLPFPKNPLNDAGFKKSLLAILKNNFTGRSMLNADRVGQIVANIDDYHFYDILTSQYLELPKKIVSNAIDLTFSQYIALRKEKSAESICHELYSPEDLQYKAYLLKLHLAGLYLMYLYPEDYFKNRWSGMKAMGEEYMEMYTDYLQIKDNYIKMIKQDNVYTGPDFNRAYF